MFTQWSDFDRTFAMLDELRRRMFDPREAAWFVDRTEGWPRTAIYDAGEQLMLKAELPGLNEKTLNLSMHEDVLTISGERPAKPQEGYTLHRQERGAARFSRSFALPYRVDAERVVANLENGVLTVTLPKHPQEKPRQIAVRAS